MFRLVAIVVLGVLSVASPAWAQTEERWGVTVGLTPSWETGAFVKSLFQADRIEMKGSEIRVGVVRGVSVGDDWGFSYVDKVIDQDSTLDIDVTDCNRGSCGTFYRTMDSTRLTGVEFHQYHAFKTWRERVQLGMTGAVGIGWMRGHVVKRTITEAGDEQSLDADVGELFPPSKSVVPLARLEIAVSAIVIPALKVRVGGGFSMPGYHTFGVTLMYLVP
jgi:hypothetical protein